MITNTQVSLEAAQEIHETLGLSTLPPCGSDNVAGSMDYIMIQLAERLVEMETLLSEQGILRPKPEPLVMWVNTWSGGANAYCSEKNARRYTGSGCTRVAVKMIEVIDE